MDGVNKNDKQGRGRQQGGAAPSSGVVLSCGEALSRRTNRSHRGGAKQRNDGGIIGGGRDKRW